MVGWRCPVSDCDLLAYHMGRDTGQHIRQCFSGVGHVVIELQPGPEAVGQAEKVGQPQARGQLQTSAGCCAGSSSGLVPCQMFSELGAGPGSAVPEEAVPVAW